MPSDTTAARAAIQAAGWRDDMENAPRDGTWFRAYRPKSVGGGYWDRHLIVRWDDEFEDFVWPTDAFDIYECDPEEQDDGGFFVHDFYESKGTLTHWKPLDTPDAPDPVAAHLGAALDRVDKLEAALRNVIEAETVSVHVGYDSAPGGGNFVYAEAVRVDCDEFVKARALLESRHDD